MSCIFLCSSFHLFICIQTVPFTNILHSYFADQLTYISPSLSPLVSVNVIKHLSLSAHVLYLPTISILCSSFYLFICTQTFPFTNILYSYLLNNQLTFPPSPCPLVSVNAISHSCLSAHVLHIFPLFIIAFVAKERPYMSVHAIS